MSQLGRGAINDGRIYFVYFNKQAFISFHVIADSYSTSYSDLFSVFTGEIIKFENFTLLTQT